MNPLTWFKNLFILVPLEQIIVEIGEEVQVDIALRDYRIRREQFARHLDVYKLQAIKDWK